MCTFFIGHPTLLSIQHIPLSSQSNSQSLLSSTRPSAYNQAKFQSNCNSNLNSNFLLDHPFLSQIISNPVQFYLIPFYFNSTQFPLNCLQFNFKFAFTNFYLICVYFNNLYLGVSNSFAFSKNQISLWNIKTTRFLKTIQKQNLWQ